MFQSSGNAANNQAVDIAAFRSFMANPSVEYLNERERFASYLEEFDYKCAVFGNTRLRLEDLVELTRDFDCEDPGHFILGNWRIGLLRILSRLNHMTWEENDPMRYWPTAPLFVEDMCKVCDMPTEGLEGYVLLHTIEAMVETMNHANINIIDAFAHELLPLVRECLMHTLDKLPEDWDDEDFIAQRA